MRAVMVETFGGPDVLRVNDIPIPEPDDGQVLIRVRAATVNPIDITTRAGFFADAMPKRSGYVLGWDVAGTVERLGTGVTGLAAGDEVIGMSEYFATPTGTQAEYVALPASSVGRAPAGVSPVEAATIPANGLTAWQSLDLLGLTEGQSVAITGAAGAVGGYAAELAVRRGLRVVGVAGTGDEEFVRGVGAMFVPRSDAPAGAITAAAGGPVDGVLDAAMAGAPMLAAIGDGGRYVGVLPGGEPPAERGITITSVGVHSDSAQLTELAGLAERGELTLRVSGTFDYASVAEAHAQLAKGGVRGRIVLVP